MKRIALSTLTLVLLTLISSVALAQKPRRQNPFDVSMEIQKLADKSDIQVVKEALTVSPSSALDRAQTFAAAGFPETTAAYLLIVAKEATDSKKTEILAFAYQRAAGHEMELGKAFCSAKDLARPHFLRAIQYEKKAKLLRRIGSPAKESLK